MRSVLFSILSVIGLSVCLVLGGQTRPALAGSDRLVMFDSRHCPTCVQFKREMARPYWNSALGKELPLSIVNTNSNRAMSRYEDQVDPIRFTPTFVIISEGQEVARSIGYNGKAHFLSEVKRMRGYWNR